MILITGGAYQGKETFARSLCVEKNILRDGEEPVVACGADSPWEALFTAHVVRDFHLYVERAMDMDAQPDAAALAAEICRRNPDVILITNELGCGIVPADPKDRAWREMTGRVCTMLAAEASQVWRIVCGIPQMLK